MESNALHWRHNECPGASNHRHFHCLFNHLFRRAHQVKHQSCALLAFMRGIHRWQRASNAENVSIWWRHHLLTQSQRSMLKDKDNYIACIYTDMFGISKSKESGAKTFTCFLGNTMIITRSPIMSNKLGLVKTTEEQGHWRLDASKRLNGWYHRADFRLAHSQWETSLQSNTVSQWLGANLESALISYEWIQQKISKLSFWLAGGTVAC